MDLFSELKSLVPEIMAAFPAIEVMYLFGSHARGVARENSDVDIGIFVSDLTDPLLDLEIGVFLENRLKKQVDVVILQKVSAILQHEVIKEQKRVFERDPEIRAKREVMTSRLYFDAVYVQERREAYRRWKNGQSEDR